MGCDTTLICITGVPRLCVSISIHILMDAQHMALAISNSLMSTQTESQYIITGQSLHIAQWHHSY